MNLFRNSWVVFLALWSATLNADLLSELKEAQKRKPFSENGNTAISPANCVYIIKGKNGSATGFLTKLYGKTLLVTNAHVILNLVSPKATNVHNTDYSIVQVVLHKTLDLALIDLEGDDTNECLELEDDLSSVPIGQQLNVYGNSLGEGIVTKLPGTFLGIGPTRIETDCGFVHGNSGSPIVSAKSGKVTGVATSVIQVGSGSWDQEGTRFASKESMAIRRFGTRIDNIDLDDFRSLDLSRCINLNPDLAGKIVASLKYVTKKHKECRKCNGTGNLFLSHGAKRCDECKGRGQLLVRKEGIRVGYELSEADRKKIIVAQKYLHLQLGDSKANVFRTIKASDHRVRLHGKVDEGYTETYTFEGCHCMGAINYMRLRFVHNMLAEIVLALDAGSDSYRGLLANYRKKYSATYRKDGICSIFYSGPHLLIFHMPPMRRDPIRKNAPASSNDSGHQLSHGYHVFGYVHRDLAVLRELLETRAAELESEAPSVECDSL